MSFLNSLRQQSKNLQRNVLPNLAQMNTFGYRVICSSLMSQQQGDSAFSSAMKAPRLDAHLHVWAGMDETDKFPYSALGTASGPPPPGNVELLLPKMEAAGVQGCLIVQHNTHLYDHSYVTSVLRRYPNKFVGCLLADATQGGGGADELERLVKEEGYRAVRFNPQLWPEGEKMTNEVGQKMYEKAGELDVPVAYLLYNGILKHGDEIEELIKLYPDTKVIIDHLAFCKTINPDSEEWQRLIGLAEYPQIHIKLSAFFRVSHDQPMSDEYVPDYQDAISCVKQLLKAYGAERLMWGTDFPWVNTQCGYVRAWDLLNIWEQIEGTPIMTQEEKEWIQGKTLASFFPGYFGIDEAVEEESEEMVMDASLATMQKEQPARPQANM
eukprot:TRINITY_DN507_c0_g1_i1.p1 TRINITY_DN507_c0_g1~~TRINITY_DN507_c0_g1_i1.p1  ORF type:complete len:382 (-),score=48.53 TRINITY_DN507_c0_g1_i1:893-2038(-)